MVFVYEHWCLMICVVVTSHDANGFDGIGVGLLVVIHGASDGFRLMWHE